KTAQDIKGVKAVSADGLKSGE
ncbi:phospholipid-binding protein, partial [Pseudomonas sp. ATCC 13867]